MEVSVVIPVYNGEKYIKNIITDLSNQVFNDFEAIFINDGSKDNSLNVLNEELANVKFRNIIISNDNEGVSAARNRGIRAASGSYICFVDVDDGIDKKYIQAQYDTLKETSADVCFCKMAENIVNDEKENVAIVGKLNALNMFMLGEFTAGVCNAMFKRELLTYGRLLFRENCVYNEDLHFVWRILASAEEVILLDKVLYYYKTVNSSAMSRFDDRRYVTIQAYEELEDFFQNNCKEFYETFRKYVVAKLLWSLTWQSAVKQSKKEYLQNIKKYNIKQYMKKLKNFPVKKVRLSSKAFLVSPGLFRLLAIKFGKKFTH